jgi:tetratricopeptide (TPR) repeat protein
MNAPRPRTFYEILQISPDASAEVVQGAYRALLKNARVHPDLGGSDAQAKLVNEAYAVLSHPARRRDYDGQLARQAAAERPAPREPARAAQGRAVQTQYILICPNCRKRNLADEGADLGRIQCGHCGAVLLPAQLKPRETDDRRAYRLGLFLYDKALHDRSRREFATAVRLKPENATYRYWLGRALVEQRTLEKARAEFQEAVRLKGGQFQSRFWLGEVQRRLKHMGEAIGAFDAALALRPGHVGTLMRVAACHFRIGEYGAAVQRLEAALEHEPRRHELHVLRGLAHMAQGDNARARAAFGIARRLRPQDALTLKYLALSERPAETPAPRSLWSAFRRQAAPGDE